MRVKPLVAVLILGALCLSIGLYGDVIRAQGKGGKLKSKPEEAQPACENKTKVFNLEPEAVDAKVKELAAEGYCIHQSNFLVVGKQVLLVVGREDLQGAGTDGECDSGEECD